MITTPPTAFKEILFFVVGGLLFVGIGSSVSRLLRPHLPNPEKLSTYESGEEPTGHARGKFNTHFYVIALVFLLFEVEVILLFPWATVFGSRSLQEMTGGLWTRFALVEGGVFITILALGLAYVWAKGYLHWIKPTIRRPSFSSKVPKGLYEAINQKTYSINKLEKDSKGQ